MNLIIMLQDNQISIHSNSDKSFAVIHSNTAGRINRTGINRIIKGNQCLLCQNPKPLIQLQRGTSQSLGRDQMGAAVRINLNLISTKNILLW